MAGQSKSKPRLKPAHAPRRRNQPGDPAGASAYAALQGPWYIHALAMAILMIGTLALYHRALGLGFFHLDDLTYVTNNPWIKGFSWANVKYVLTTPYFANFAPVHLLSYMLDYQLAGDSARAFHLSNLVWGGLVPAMLYLLGLVVLAPPPSSGQAVPSRWTDSTPLRAFLAAALFVVHPAHVEALAWISSRKDLIAAAFALPAMLAYFLHRRNPSNRLGYVLALILFTLAAAAKLSVVVLPGVLLAFDWFVERRRGWRMVLDKIPFGVAVLPFALRTLDTQPSTEQSFSFYSLGLSTLRHLWLMTGLGDHVLFPDRPNPQAPVLFKALCVAGLLFLLLIPLKFQNRKSVWPAALFLWLMLALIPSQVLSFVYPVADRYLFFPSAAAVLLLVWTARSLTPRRRTPGSLAPVLVLVALGAVWGYRTHNYLSEWCDPRSVWFAARAKSNDYLIHQYLGTHYQDQADDLLARLRGGPAERAQAEALARAVWHDHEQLPVLLQQWQVQTNSMLTPAFRETLRALAIEQFDQALRKSGTRLTPNLHFRLGKLALENKEFDRARAAFTLADRQAQAHTSPDIREDVSVRSLHALGVLEWHARNYREALRWMLLAEEAQNRARRHFIPELTSHRQQLERLAQGTAPNTSR